MKRRPQKPILKLPKTLPELREEFKRLSSEVQSKQGVKKTIVEYRLGKRRGETQAMLDEQEMRLLTKLCEWLWECLHEKQVAHYTKGEHEN